MQDRLLELQHSPTFSPKTQSYSASRAGGGMDHTYQPVFPSRSLLPLTAGTTEFSAGIRAYSVPIVRTSHPHVIEGETWHKCSHSARTWKEKNDGDVWGKRMHRHHWLNLWTFSGRALAKVREGWWEKRLITNILYSKRIRTEHDNVPSDQPSVEYL